MILFLFVLVFSINGATIKGVVYDSKKGTPLQGANIVVDGTKRGAFTNLDGVFSVEELEVGNYKVTISMIGYERVEKNVTIKRADELVELKVYLKEKPLVAEQVVVTASRREDAILNSSVAIGVYEPDIAQVRNIVSMDRAINYVGGVTMNREQVSIRNSSGYAYGTGSRVLLLIDGIPLLAGDTGEIKWDAVPISNIKRIEVVKQAGSALYGSNALGGVINFVTSDPDAIPLTRVTGRFGFYEKPYYKEWRWTDKFLYFQSFEISHSRRVNGLGLILSVDEKTNCGYRQNEDFKRLHSFFKGSYDINDVKRVLFGYNMGYEEHGSFTMWRNLLHPFELDPESIGNKIWSFKFNFYVSYETRNLLRAELTSIKYNAYYNSWNDNFSDEVNNAGNWSRSLQNAFYLQHNLSPFKFFELNNTVTIGSDLYYSKVKSKIFRDHWAAGLSCFGQDEIDLTKNLNLNFGLRLDIHKVDSLSSWNNINPKLGLVYKFAKKFSTRLSAGRGYRVPTIAELFTQTITSGLKIEPNPKLKPESVWSYDVGCNYFGDKIYLSLSLFRNDYYNMIEATPDSFDNNGNVIVRFKNYTRARIEGTEIESKIRLWKVNLIFDYTFTNTRDIKSDSVLPYRPDHIVKLTSEIELNRNLGFACDYIYKSRVKRVLLYTDDPRVAAHILDLRSTAKLARFTFTVVCSNLLDYYYSDIERNINAPRNWSIGISTDF